MIRNFKISQIIVGENRRKADLVKVHALAESIKEIGLLNPITLNNECELLAGLHRLEACKLLGKKEIECNFIGGGYLQYALAEIDENLLRNELSVLERAEHLERRKDIYEEMYPQTKHGANVQNLKQGSSIPEVAISATSEKKDSFVESTSKLTGDKPRTIYQDISISKNLTPEVKEIIRNEPIADKKTELLKLAKHEPEQQKEIVEKLARQEIKRVPEVKKQYIEEPIPTVEKPDRDNDLEDLKNELLTVLNAYKSSKSIKCVETVKQLKDFLNYL